MLMTEISSGVTRLLAAVRGGGEGAVNQLIPAVYEELRRLAKHHMAGQRRGHTLQTRDLVNEAYLKLVNLQETGWKDRIHFFAVASRAMRSVLVDYARRRGYAKRGANPVRVSLSEVDQISEQKSAEVIAVDEALSRLAALDPRKSQIVELRYFGGLTVEETAELLGLSSRTIKREWRWARAWLYRELGDERSR
jgi:RNA polymerase sigma factor (TIGR02999 family)